MKHQQLKFPLILCSLIALQGCVAAAVVGVAGGVNVMNDERTVGQQIDDQSIELNAYAAINNNEELSKHTNIQLTSVNGSLLIVGQAPNVRLKDIAIKLVSEVKTVKQVHNQLRIANTTSLGTRTNDVWLTSKVKTVFFANDRIKSMNIKVVTENAEVFLMGLVNQEQASIAVDVARNVAGVNRVFKAFEIQ
jgi:osmotically-inducible protein OsmY